MAHPQTVWNSSELDHLRSVRTTTHSTLANNLRTYLDRYKSTPVAGSNVMGFAMMTRIWGDQAQDKANAIASLMNHCNAEWSADRDLNQARDILNAAVGYDVLYDLLSSGQRTTCRNKIAASAQDLASAADGGIWWATDLVQNHNWVNIAAIGVAGQALEGEHANAAHWQDIARANFQKVKAVQDLVTDGGWHEGIGYMEFGLERSIAYWLGAVRRGINDDKTKMLSKVGRYILYAQLPNQPRVHVMTHGDWNWSRPGLIAALRWAAKRFQDPYAHEAARRWDLDQRLTRVEFGLAYALEYAAYDPNVPSLNTTKIPLDVYNEDQQSMIMRSRWSYGKTSPSSDPIVVGFKAGVFGGRGNYRRMGDCNPPGGILNYSHDHEDDLGLWIYGKGGWLLPEAVAYNCCDRGSSKYHSTPWHNTFLFDGQGQLGDNKTVAREESKSCGSTQPAWFYEREASMPLHASTDHYAFARGDGRRLYPSALNVTTLMRTVGLSRENGGFIALRDRAVLGTSRKIEQLFHAMTPAPATTNGDSPWLKLTNLNGSVLGIRVLYPKPYAASITTQDSNNWQENMDDDGQYGYVRVSPTTSRTSTTFLEVLWPTKTADWANRPNVQPLTATEPYRGFSVPLGNSTESWIYNSSGTSASGGDLTIQASSAYDIGIKRSTSAGTLERVVLRGAQGGRLLDQNGARTLLDLGSHQGALEVAFTGTIANLSGTAGISGVRFFGPSVTEVRHKGSAVQWSRSGSTVTVT
jgi:Domain of unknown function (DUF4962)